MSFFKNGNDTIEEKLNLIIDLLTDNSEVVEEEKEEIKENTDNETIEEKKEDDKEEIKENTETVDKRKNIDEVGGFLKSKGLTDEDIRYVMKLMEKDAYENQEEKTLFDDKKEEEKEEIKQNSCKGKDIKKNCEEEKKEEPKPETTITEKIEKDIRENSIEKENSFKTRRERIEEANKNYYVN